MLGLESIHESSKVEPHGRRIWLTLSIIYMDEAVLGPTLGFVVLDVHGLHAFDGSGRLGLGSTHFEGILSLLLRWSRSLERVIYVTSFALQGRKQSSRQPLIWAVGQNSLSQNRRDGIVSPTKSSEMS